MHSSFISEHSLEYIIVPNICNIISAKYKRIIPIYYWATREGNRMSDALHCNLRVRILSIFPRRPKIENVDSDYIHGKLNKSILRYAEVANSIGIPTIFCMPLVKSFIDISNECECLYLDCLKFNDVDLHFRVNYRDKAFNIESEYKSYLTILDETKILEKMASGTIMNWNDANQNMKQLRHVNEEYSLFWMSQYKPIYFLVME
jgi:hypothetical protein